MVTCPFFEVISLTPTMYLVDLLREISTNLLLTKPRRMKFQYIFPAKSAYDENPFLAEHFKKMEG